MRRNLGMCMRPNRKTVWVPRLKRNYTFLRRQKNSQFKFGMARVLIRVRDPTPRDHYPTGLSRESLALRTFQKTPRLRPPLGGQTRTWKSVGGASTLRPPTEILSPAVVSQDAPFSSFPEALPRTHPI